jgi:hypothetical protein
MRRMILAATILSLAATGRYPADAQVPCPAPAPDQIVVFENVSRLGNCRVLSIGRFASAAAFAPVRNDSISSISVGAGVRAVLYQHANFGGLKAHYEGGRAGRRILFEHVPLESRELLVPRGARPRAQPPAGELVHLSE